MRQRFAVREPSSWVPLLFIFATVLYAFVEITDRGLEALTFWLFIAAGEVAVFMFVFRRNYVELEGGHLTWVKWGHKVVKIAVSEIRQVTLKGSLVNILLTKATLPPDLSLHRSTGTPWLMIPAADPQGLTSSLELAVRASSGWIETRDVQAELPSAPPEIELIPADRWRRTLAVALDAFVLVGFLFTASLAKTAHLDEGEKPDDFGLYYWTVVITWVGYAWFSNVLGFSLGKIPLGLRVVRAGTDRSPGPWLGTVRVVVALSGFAVAAIVAMFFMPIRVVYVGLAVLAIQHLWSVVDPKRSALYDIVARTRVVQTVFRHGDEHRQPESR